VRFFHEEEESDMLLPIVESNLGDPGGYPPFKSHCRIRPVHSSSPYVRPRILQFRESQGNVLCRSFAYRRSHFFAYGGLLPQDADNCRGRESLAKKGECHITDPSSSVLLERCHRCSGQSLWPFRSCHRLG